MLAGRPLVPFHSQSSLDAKRLDRESLGRREVDKTARAVPIPLKHSKSLESEGTPERKSTRRESGSAGEGTYVVKARLGQKKEWEKKGKGDKSIEYCNNYKPKSS